MESQGDHQLNIYFLPYPTQGHMIPMVDTARLFAAHGVSVTIITTPANALLFQQSIDHDIKLGHNIRIQVIPFPCSESGLPLGIENFNSITSIEMAGKLLHAIFMLQPTMEQILFESKPDCIVTDMFLPWTVDAARKLGIPRFIFNSSSYFGLCAEHSVKHYMSSQSMESLSDTEAFVLPGLPHKIEMTKLQIEDWLKASNEFSQFIKVVRESEKKSYGAIFNSFYELERDYEKYYKTFIGVKPWSIGPISWAVNRDSADKAQRGNKSEVEEHECISWLNSKEHNSVLYVSFGSLTKFPSDQLLEIAAGLEASGKQFMWVVRKIENEGDLRLLEGFEQKMRENKKGFIIKGWAPQLLILDHPAIGGLITHCGWNSILEGLSAGLPMITWPMFAEQFYNEKLVIDVLKIGVPVGVTRWSPTFVVNEIVKRDKVEKAVTMVMGGGMEAMEMRKRAGELSAAAKRAGESCGSSESNLIALINEIKEVKLGGLVKCNR